MTDVDEANSLLSPPAWARVIAARPRPGGPADNVACHVNP